MLNYSKTYVKVVQQQEEKTETIYGVETSSQFLYTEGGEEEEYYGRSVMSAACRSSSVSHFSQM
jgi:hypothetical protein